MSTLMLSAPPHFKNAFVYEQSKAEWRPVQQTMAPKVIKAKSNLPYTFSTTLAVVDITAEEIARLFASMYDAVEGFVNAAWEVGDDIAEANGFFSATQLAQAYPDPHGRAHAHYRTTPVSFTAVFWPFQLMAADGKFYEFADEEKRWVETKRHSNYRSAGRFGYWEGFYHPSNPSINMSGLELCTAAAEWANSFADMSNDKKRFMMALHSMG